MKQMKKKVYYMQWPCKEIEAIKDNVMKGKIKRRRKRERERENKSTREIERECKKRDRE